jgi:anti-sigma regulatory factor (Ser/Thr protein kinase)
MQRVWLAGGRDAPAGARAALDLITVEHFDEAACDDLRLMVSELVANSVLHGGAGEAESSIYLEILLTVALLRVECSDPVGGFDQPPLPRDPTRTHGYGLSIIDALSSRWGTRAGPDGATWFENDRNGRG